MVRATADSVKKLVPTDISDLTIFIETANMVVNDNLLTTGISEPGLTKIEIYLAAHFLCLVERQPKSQKFGDSASKFLGVSGLGLNGTLFGQSAIILDYSGKLRNASNDYAKIEVI
jgi:hypothetical protein